MDAIRDLQVYLGAPVLQFAQAYWYVFAVLVVIGAGWFLADSRHDGGFLWFGFGGVDSDGGDDGGGDGGGGDGGGGGGD